MNILGIDPGLNGAMCLLNGNGVVVYLEVMPKIKVKKGHVLDEGALLRMLEDAKEIAQFQEAQGLQAYVEKVNAMPATAGGKIVQGIASTFKFGEVVGATRMGLKSTKIPSLYIAPRQWTSWAYRGLPGTLKGKERSLLAVANLFPGESFLASSRCRKPHDGLVDARLIAEFGYRESKHGNVV